MNRSERGRKHVCPECECKYYDLKKEVVACPKCGSKPPKPKATRSTQAAAKANRAPSGRFPRP
jgi:uncharacterized protein (TIGR02300 family)